MYRLTAVGTAGLVLLALLLVSETCMQYYTHIHIIGLVSSLGHNRLMKKPLWMNQFLSLHLKIWKTFKVELPTYLACAAGVSADFSPLEWWKNNSSNLTQWSAAAKKKSCCCNPPQSLLKGSVFIIEGYIQ